MTPVSFLTGLDRFSVLSRIRVLPLICRAMSVPLRLTAAGALSRKALVLTALDQVPPALKSKEKIGPLEMFDSVKKK